MATFTAPPWAQLLNPDLRKRIEIMAEHIARNGPDFENTVRQKNVGNPQFAFLYDGGEGQEYYLYALAAYRSQKPAAAAAAGGDDFSRLSLLADRWKEPSAPPLAPEVDRQLSEVVASLEAMASRDAIRNGRSWLENIVGTNTTMASSLAATLKRRIIGLQTPAHRLHILYLVHDVLQTEAARKDGVRRLIGAFKPFLVWLLRPSYQFAQKAHPNGSEPNQMLRLLQLWSERGILDGSEAEDIKALVTAPAIPGVADPQVGVASPRPAAPGAAGQLAPGTLAGLLHGQLPQSQQQQQPPPPQSPPPGTAPIGGLVNQPPPPQRPPAGVPVPPRGYQPLMAQLPSRLTPETVPVGVLSTMVMHAMRRVGKPNFIPYKPLDTSQTPQVLPHAEAPNERLLERLEDFYLDLKDEEQSSSNSSRSSSPSSSRSRSRSRSPEAKKRTAFAPPSNFGPGPMSAVPPPAID